MSHPRHHPDEGSWTRLRNALDLDPRDVGMILVFALCVGLLSIVAPAAIETLVNTVAFGVLLWPVIALALVMLTLLIISAALKSLQILVSEYLQRRLFVRYAERFSARFREPTSPRSRGATREIWPTGFSRLYPSIRHLPASWWMLSASS